MKVQDFLNTKLVNYASYDNIRSIASCIDGLKNAGRKVLYTVHEKKIKDKIKVSQLASKCAEFSDYLHGDVSLQGVVVTLGQDFCGTNNIPLLKKYGNFGTRSAHSASAPRYIFAKGSDEFFKLFKYEDDPILELQTFEGSKIEPRFYLPTLPMLLVNGSEGISSGFAQKILPRNPENLKKYIKEKLKGKIPSKDLLVPWYKDYNGEIVRDTEKPNKWWISGKVHNVKKNEWEIDEIPFSYELKEYLKLLDDLQESGVILKYSNESDGYNVLKFKVWMPKNVEYTEEKVMELLKLWKCTSENYTSVNEFNKISEFQTSEEVINHYIEIKLEYLQKRKDYNITKWTQDIIVLKSKMNFIKNFNEGKLSISGKTKDEIIAQLDNFSEISKVDDSYQYLLNMPLYSLTKERMESLAEDIEELSKKIKLTEETSIQQLWLNDLKEL